jgi:iron(III) transport system substrate-binding protein
MRLSAEQWGFKTILVLLVTLRIIIISAPFYGWSLSMRTFAKSLLMLVGLYSLAACEPNKPVVTDATEETRPLVVYSARNEHLIKPLFDRYTEQTGVPVTYVTDKAGPLLARLQAEGDSSPADILMTVDAGNLWQAAEAGILQPITSPVLLQNVPSHLRDAQNRWFALTVRARTIVYSTERVKPEALSTYAALGDAAWQGRLCLRTSKKVYNQSLVASMIAARGESNTEALVENWVANLALPPFANDTKVVEAIVAGQCDVGVVNTYYFGGMQEQTPDLAAALFWPNQQGEGADGRGVHVNVSGAGVTAASKQVDQARQLLEWLSGEEAQSMLMNLNMEYPVLPNLPLSERLQSWGQFKADSMPVSEAGRLQAAAVRLMDRAGYR